MSCLFQYFSPWSPVSHSPCPDRAFIAENTHMSNPAFQVFLVAIDQTSSAFVIVPILGELI